MANLKFPALGYRVSLGALYDARTDRFSGSILGKTPPDNATTSSPTPKQDTFYSKSDTFQERCNSLRIPAETACSILTEQLKPRGSSVHMLDTCRDSSIIRGAIHHRVQSVTQKLDLTLPNIQDFMDIRSCQLAHATHVVMRVSWGLHMVLEIKYRLSDDDSASETKEAFRIHTAELKSAMEAAANCQPFEMPEMLLQYEYTLYTDALQGSGVFLDSPQEALEFIQLIPSHIRQSKEALGWPLSYTLFPLDGITHFIPLCNEIGIAPPPIDAKYFTNFVRLFDEYEKAERELLSYYNRLSQNELYISPTHIEDVEFDIDDLIDTREMVIKTLVKQTHAIRSGKTPPDALLQLSDKIKNGRHNAGSFCEIVGKENSKIDFINTMVSQGAIYLGYNGFS